MSSTYSVVGHRDLAIMNPISSDTLDTAVGGLGLSPRARVLDVGCGKGELLRRVVSVYHCEVEGIDLSPTLIEEAKRLVPSGTFRVADARKETFAESAYDLVACIGAAHAFGTTRDALKALARAGQLVLFGDAYFRREPDPEYLAATGMTRDEFLSPESTIELAWQAGLTLRETFLASEVDFVRYETTHARAIAAYAQSRPDDAEAASMYERSRVWHDAFERFGRTTMGFALFLFERIDLST